MSKRPNSRNERYDFPFLIFAGDGNASLHKEAHAAKCVAPFAAPRKREAVEMLGSIWVFQESQPRRCVMHYARIFSWGQFGVATNCFDSGCDVFRPKTVMQIMQWLHNDPTPLPLSDRATASAPCISHSNSRVAKERLRGLWPRCYKHLSTIEGSAPPRDFLTLLGRPLLVEPRKAESATDEH